MNSEEKASVIWGALVAAVLIVWSASDYFTGVSRDKARTEFAVACAKSGGNYTPGKWSTELGNCQQPVKGSAY